MIPTYSRHFVTTERDKQLPLHLTTMGYAEHQNPVSREHGFYCFHWLHTVEGCGDFIVNGKQFKLPANHGILLKPGVPHSYSPESTKWSTWFLTFDGSLANPITASLELQHMQPLNWDVQSPLAKLYEHFEEKCRNSIDFAGINGSLEVYAFLAQIKQFGQLSGQLSLSKGHERLTPIYQLIEEEFGNPDLGLPRMAKALGISTQYLSTLFSKSWGVSPYQYLLQFRIQKSKELLVSDQTRTVREIASVVGFQDDSHFVHTFHRLTGMTPVRFRQQYSE